MVYDLIVLGAGPAGYTAAERAGHAGMKVLLIEKNSLGGVCLNEGCIPTKTLLYSAKILDSVHTSAKYAVMEASASGIDLGKLMSRKTKVVRKLVAGVKAKVSDAGVEVINAEGRIKSVNGDGTVTVVSADEDYTAKHLLLSTGSETFIPPIPGLSNIPYWTSREALQAKEIPRELVVIGGGVIGMEFASFFNSIGSRVTVIEMLPEILAGMDLELSAMLRKEYEKKGVRFLLNHKVVEVSDRAVRVSFGGEETDIEADRVLLSVGRRPLLGALGEIVFEYHGYGIKVNERMQTSVPNIYAAGDITGFSLLAHTAVREAEVAVNDMLGKADTMSYAAIPGVVYTNPEIAGVGLTEELARERGIAYTLHSLPMAFSGRFVAENEQGNGVFKLLVSNDKVIGAHMLGNPAGELIVIAGMAIETGLSLNDFKRIVFPHPTVGEIIREALF